jgi:subtilase family serine protease
MSRTRRGLAATAALLTIGGGVLAQSATGASAAPAITWHKTVSKPVIIKGTSLLGATSKSRVLHLDVVLTPRNAKKEKTALKKMYTPGSGSYHKFLTPAQFKASYAPTAASVTAVKKYLRGAGLTHVKTAKNRQLVTATATVANASKAFHTGFSTYQAGKKTFYTNTRAAAVPARLSGLVTSIVGLSDAPLPMPHPTVAKKAAVGTPNLDGITPKDFQTTYDATGTATGSKTAIALFTEGSQTQTFKDLRLAEQKNGLPQVAYTEYKVGPQSTDTAGADEWDLDTQSSTAMAQNVKHLYLYNVGSLVDSQILLAFNRFVADDKAKSMSASIGGCDINPYLDGSLVASDVVLQEGAMQGQTLFASSGDNGEGCAYVAATGVPSSFPGTNWPASGEFTTGVGGTSLISDASGNRIEEPAWIGSGGGISEVENPGWWTEDSDPAFDAEDVSGGRAVPDISLDADPNTTAALIYVDGAVEGVGGTSLSAPLMNGVWSRLESADGNNLGLASIDFYALYDKVNPALGDTGAVKGFTDIVGGSNGLYVATPGYDEVTGIGAPDVKPLVAALK